MSGFTFNNRSPIPYDDDDLVWASPLVWIVRRIQDDNYDERFTPQLKEKINEYINNPEHTINDKVKDLNYRTMLSWTAESEKLDIFKFLLDNGATDNWQKLLIRSNNYYTKVKEKYDAELEEDYEIYNSLMARIQAVVDEAVAAEQDDLDYEQHELTVLLDNEADEIVENRLRKDLLLKKQKELNDFIKEYVQKLEARTLPVAAAKLPKPLPADIIGEISGYILPSNDMRNKTIKRYETNIIANKSRKRKAESPESLITKKQKNTGGKKKINKKSNRKSKKNLKKASRKCRK
tara:strand:- start:891 stop:1766 length:876 start_codon:yes stop_codon:yes gene_type:complete